MSQDTNSWTRRSLIIISKTLERIGNFIESAGDIVDEYGKKGTAQSLLSSCFSWLKYVAVLFKNIATDTYSELNPKVPPKPKTGGTSQHTNDNETTTDYFTNMIKQNNNKLKIDRD